MSREDRFKFAIDDLDALANLLESKSNLAEAQAKIHLAAGQESLYRDEIKRRDSGRHFAQTCRIAASRLRVRAKRGAFVPPDEAEVLAYAKELGWPDMDALAWMDHFRGNGWKVAGKTQMEDWRACARNGYRRWKRDGKAPPRPRDSESLEPAQWREFLRMRKLNYQPFATAQPYLKSEFTKTVK